MRSGLPDRLEAARAEARAAHAAGEAAQRAEAERRLATQARPAAPQLEDSTAPCIVCLVAFRMIFQDEEARKAQTLQLQQSELRRGAEESRLEQLQSELAAKQADAL